MVLPPLLVGSSQLTVIEVPLTSAVGAAGADGALGIATDAKTDSADDPNALFAVILNT